MGTGVPDLPPQDASASPAPPAPPQMQGVPAALGSGKFSVTWLTVGPIQLLLFKATRKRLPVLRRQASLSYN